jgi:pilus assembly protein Flp/PilA
MQDEPSYTSLESERGAGLAEYGLLLMLIAMVCIGTIGLLGATLADLYDTIRTTLFP